MPGTPLNETDAVSVLLIEDSIGVGGSIVSLANFVLRLDRGSYEPHIVVYHESQRQYLESRFQEPVDIVVSSPRRLATDIEIPDRLRTVGGRLGEIFRRIYRVFAFATTLVTSIVPYAVRMAWALRHRNIGLVHLNTGVCLPGVIIARLLRVPCIATQRGPEYKSPIIRWFSKGIDRFIAISEEIESDLINLGVEESLIRILNPPVDPDVFNPKVDANNARRSFGVAPADTCVGIVGILEEWKGHRIFLESARLVLNEKPDVRFFVVGGSPTASDDYQNELACLTNKLSITKQVTFTGFRDDVPQVMQMFDIIVHASLVPEPFGKVVIEAMAMRKPVIATDAGGPAEIIANGVDGLLTPIGNAGALASAILEILGNNDLASRLADAGYRKAGERYGVSSYVDSLSQEYRALLA